ncbi:acyl-CoA dehydrogenase [Streptomyces sp. SP18CS02]|uniref:acyl-CoA dehydrogenase n=1 Tax=Streptomyces sp. SP18CS02 TaxID=3002531 RepID=UPI002E777A72|nr:acyl-CoA dehydrogenase [Streptomyces sp. SP18CS02]MEE1754667.1 acyl-CoA dehydrogenase [Streptomyces sp. SP18CS02]
MSGGKPKKSVVRPAPSRAERPADEELWPRVTRELADDLAFDAPARDRAGKPPFDEVARLREAGLLSLLTPPGPAPHEGADWRLACGVLREVAAADSSIAELLGRHYVLAWSARFFGETEAAARIERRCAQEQWLLAGGIEPADPEQDQQLTLTPIGNGYVLNGRRDLAAGLAVADRLVLGAPCADTGESLIALVDPAHPGVIADMADERLGQRLTGAGSVSFDNVPVSADQVLGAVPRDEHAVSPFTALAPLALRLTLVHVGLGIAEGALAEARDVSRATLAAWPSPDGAAGLYGSDAYGDRETDDGYGPYTARPNGDPYLLLAYGELATSAHAASAVVERATEALARGLLAGAALTVDERADIAVLVAAAEAVTSRSAVHVTTRILELTDGSGTSHGATGFDRFWRNARVLTAQVSPAHRLRDIGDHYLNGTHPRLTLSM